jgi:hypothetical protein
MNNNYLTETKLGEYLKILYPKDEFIRNKCVPNSNSKYRPDYRNDNLKLIVEFDGYSHYTSSKTILSDIKKDRIFKSMGYNIIRIPYFIQISNGVTLYLFGKTSKKINQIYPHGFIDHKCIMPADFCELGLEKFKEDLENFFFIKNDILKSLENKINECGEILKILPPSWYNQDEHISHKFEDNEYKKFYNEYKILGGKKQPKEYEFYLKIFFALTLNSFTGGDCYFDSRKEALDKFIYIIGSVDEMNLFFNSVDNIHSYS